MATRDKTREQRRYGCVNQAAFGCGILMLRNDNGTGLRNSEVIEGLMGIGTINGITRTYSPEDRAHDESFFGTLEDRFFKLMPGYTGRHLGELLGYDAILNGVVDVEMLYGMITRYLVDEYPFERHYGVGMGGRRPWDVYEEINTNRGHVKLPDPNIRRIQLGWEDSATPSDEGVRVFGGIWFDSERLQRVREEPHLSGKVRVFVDPDNLNIATVLVPGHPEPIEVHLQITAFADMTLGEVLQLMAEYRREDPATTEIYHDRLMGVKTRRFANISSISVEHDLPRSYTTIEECKAMAKVVFAGARVIRTETLPGITAPNAITSLAPGAGVFEIGGGTSVIDGVANEVPGETTEDITDPVGSPTVSGHQLPSTPPVKTVRPQAPDEKSPDPFGRLVRPKNLKDLK